MSIETFRQALQVAENHGEHLVLGGGEPTIHPQFEKLLLEAIAQSSSDEFQVLVITNGKHKLRALMLAALMKRDVIGAELSTDQYHEAVHWSVMEAFQGHYRDNSKHNGRMILAGRYLETVCLSQDSVPEDEPCCCEDWIVEPNGTIKQCGCYNAPVIGHVVDGIDPKYQSCSGMCHRSSSFAEEIEDAEEAA